MSSEWHSENPIIIFSLFRWTISFIVEYALFQIQFLYSTYIISFEFFHDFFSAFLRCFMSTKNMREIIWRKSKATATSNRKSRKSTRRTFPLLCKYWVVHVLKKYHRKMIIKKVSAYTSSTAHKRTTSLLSYLFAWVDLLNRTKSR